MSKQASEEENKELNRLEIIHTTYKEMIKENNYISKDKIIEWLDRFELEEDLQEKYDELSGSEAITKFLKQLLKENNNE